MLLFIHIHRVINFFIGLVAISAFALLASGCGYALQGSGTVLPDDVRVIAIPAVENDTLESNIGLRLTEAIRSSFERYGVVTVVDNPEQADAVFKARIVTIKNQTRDVTSGTDIALQQQVYITVAAELRKSTGQLLWKDDNITNSETYGSVAGVVVTSNSSFAQGNLNANTLSRLSDREVGRGQKDQALQSLVDETARQLYLQAVAADF